MDLVPLCSMPFNVVGGSPLFALINIDTPMHLFFFLSTKTTLYNTQKRASCQEMENILRFENDSIVTLRHLQGSHLDWKSGKAFSSQGKYWKTQKNVICSDI